MRGWFTWFVLKRDWPFIAGLVLGSLAYQWWVS